MESHSKVSREVNKAQTLMKLSTKREVFYGLSTTKLKTTMSKKNQMTQANDSSDSMTELVELSDEALSEVRGGGIDINLLDLRKDWKLPVIANPILPIPPCDPKVILIR